MLSCQQPFVLRHVVGLWLFVWCWIVVSCTIAAPVGAQSTVWQPPVDAPIVDHFRPPVTRYGKGNRGIEYGLSGSTPIQAVADGTVTFAGSIGGTRHVVVQHSDGLRSTYAFLDSIAVVRGQRVLVGAAIGRASSGFHLTARLGDSYVDPELLLAGASIVTRLTNEVDPPTTSGRPGTIVQQSLAELHPEHVVGDLATLARQWWHQECTSDSVTVGPVARGRLLVTVGGLGSSGGEASIDDLALSQVGYRDSDVVRFSYEGGCVPGPDSPEWIGAELPQHDYDATATYGDVRVQAQRLADLIARIHEQHPGRPIDLAAHSLGGVIARLAVEELALRYPGDIPVAVVMTIGSPHNGADLATAAQAEEGLRTSVVEAVMGDRGELVDALAVAQVAEIGPAALQPPGPPPPGVVAIAVAGPTDVVVPAEAAVWDGAINVVASDFGSVNAHSTLPSLASVSRELALAVGRQPPRCQRLRDMIANLGAAGVVDLAENALGVVMGW